jgi:hypothetical protein
VQTYNVIWTHTALESLSRLSYPDQVLEDILIDSQKRLSLMPTALAEEIPFGEWDGYYARIGLHRVLLIFEVDRETEEVFVEAVLHSRQQRYWNR